MPIARCFARRADHKPLLVGHQLIVAAATLAALLALSSCAPPPVPAQSVQASVPATPPPPPPTPVPFDQAVLNAANAVLSTAPIPAGGRQLVVIDPLVDGVTGEQSTATRAIGERIAALAQQKYPQFDIQPFTPDAVARSPYVMVGTFTPVNAQNAPTGEREAFRFCLVMADLRSGKTVAKGVARARMEGVDSTPTPFFRDSPAWTDDTRIKGYINTCQATRVGDPIAPLYLNGIVAASIIAEANDAYSTGRYRDALGFYANARAAQGGDQLRVLNGLYLANWQLGRQEDAATAFASVVDYGLANNRLGVKLIFRPGSTALDPGGARPQPYDLWLQQIAGRTARSNACLQVTGNTSKSGPPALNDRLSLLRAEYIVQRLEEDSPGLHGRLIANGVGSRENLIGTGSDDLSDALDRRVEFKVIPSC